MAPRGLTDHRSGAKVPVNPSAPWDIAGVTMSVLPRAPDLTHAQIERTLHSSRD